MPSPEGTLYDNPEQTVTVLRGFWLAHSEQLKKIPMKFPEALMKYDTTLQVFAEAHGRVTSLGGRETMDFMSVRQIIEDDDNDEDQDELDEVVLSSFKYTRAFRRKYFSIFLSLFFLIPFSLIYYLLIGLYSSPFSWCCCCHLRITRTQICRNGFKRQQRPIR